MNDADPDEPLFARDPAGQLLRREKATHDDLARPIRDLKVDGVAVPGVKFATEARDGQGNVLVDDFGVEILRRTTIYDAVAKHYENTTPRSPDGRIAVPILCHQDHLQPQGLCRVCSVLVGRGNEARAQLQPACHAPVEDGMEIHTRCSAVRLQIQGAASQQVAGDYVEKAVTGLIQLLGGDHLHAEQQVDDYRYHNELLALVKEFRLNWPGTATGRVQLDTPYRRKANYPKRVDLSSSIIHVDHSQCILCDRCVRACSEVRPFEIISHTGYGKQARISFDLDMPMEESECVKCGECAVSCPTGALSFTGSLYKTKVDRGKGLWDDMKQLNVRLVRTADLAQVVAQYGEGSTPGVSASTPEVFDGLGTKTLKRLATLFGSIPLSFLYWNEGAIGFLACTEGEIIVKKDTYGAAAFLILEGMIEVEGSQCFRTPDDVIVGEMACMSNLPRTASLSAAMDSKLLVIRRNVLHLLLRNRGANTNLKDIYSKRAVSVLLNETDLFQGLSAKWNQKCADFLRTNWKHLQLQNFDPGQTIVRQGAVADCFYFIRRGNVLVTQTMPGGNEIVRDYMGAGRHLGELGVLSDPGASSRVALAIERKELRGKRQATCRALDHVELVRIDRDLFAEMLDLEPGIRAHFEDYSVAIREKNQAPRASFNAANTSLREFTRQGLHQGQSLLVLDLTKCTRCQECVRGCADSHRGVTRLLLEGERFDRFLVPSACRSCHDPVCLIGCPVDAIHRRPSVEGFAIVIEDWCIGCSLCAHNCPFGSIHMAPKDGNLNRPPAVSAPTIATNCDLCESLDGVPRCVYACPHDAAHRMRGEKLAKMLSMDVLAAAPQNQHRESSQGT